ncbi:MAG: FAD-dependent oxidoreductase [Erysipelotrichaceae bacterium]|nr:FAD-dependent oxidoreductase [Erysipelotrichaceae bacterium]
MITELTAYCLSCPRPKCETGCPCGNHIRDYIKAMKDEDIEKAAAILYSVNPLPELTSRLCDCDRQCQGHCVRGLRGEPVQIQQIERYISDHSKRPFDFPAAGDKKIAVIGSGPAALSLVYELRQNGCTATVYEKEEQIGGAIYTGIPDYRFDKMILEKIREEWKSFGTEFRFGSDICKEDLKTLCEENDAVILAVGASVENTAGFETNDRILGGLSLLYKLNVEKDTDSLPGKRAYVWGGGNVAMDCTRSLIRYIDDVTVLYRRSLKEMPANGREIEEAMAEGVKFAYLHNIKEVRQESDHLVLTVCEMELGETGIDGRASVSEKAGTLTEVETDMLVMAIGQKTDLHIAGLSERPAAHHIGSNLFICGDAFTGPKTVVKAIRDGKETAKEVLKYLEGGDS